MANTGANPQDVVAPQAYWRLIDVLHECDDWSMALGRWKGDTDWRPVLALRWNGWEGSKGNPASHGHPTWFVVPDDLYPLLIASTFIPQSKQALARDILGIQPIQPGA